MSAIALNTIFNWRHNAFNKVNIKCKQDFLMTLNLWMYTEERVAIIMQCVYLYSAVCIFKWVPGLFSIHDNVATYVFLQIDSHQHTLLRIETLYTKRHLPTHKTPWETVCPFNALSWQESRSSPDSGHRFTVKVTSHFEY